MAVGGDQRFLDREADHLLARAHHARGAAPLVEQHAGALDVARLHRELDAGEVVAELAEAEREVEHRDVEGEREHAARGARAAHTGATASATGGSTATIQATRPWRRSPPLNARSSDAAQAASAPETLLRSPSGRHCSISSAAMIARTLMRAFY